MYATTIFALLFWRQRLITISRTHWTYLVRRSFQKKILINVILWQVLPVSLTDGGKSKWRNIHFAIRKWMRQICFKFWERWEKMRKISEGQLGSTQREEAEPKTRAICHCDCIFVDAFVFYSRMNGSCEGHGSPWEVVGWEGGYLLQAWPPMVGPPPCPSWFRLPHHFPWARRRGWYSTPLLPWTWSSPPSCSPRSPPGWWEPPPSWPLHLFFSSLSSLPSSFR